MTHASPTAAIEQMGETDVYSQAGESGFEGPKAFVTPVQCRRKFSLRGGKRPTDTNIAAKLAVFQKQDLQGPDTMADYLAYHSASDDDKGKSSSIRKLERPKWEDSPSETVSSATDDSKLVVSPADSTAGSVLSRYGKPEDFIQNTPGGTGRRSWISSPRSLAAIAFSAPTGSKSKVASLRNITLPLMDISGHSHTMDSSAHSHTPTSYRRPPMTSSAGAGAGVGFTGYGKLNALLSPPVSKQKKPWRPKRVSEATPVFVPEDLPPAFKASLSPKPSPKRNSAPARFLDVKKIELVSKREKSNLKPMKLKRKWPPSTSKAEISTDRGFEVVPKNAVKNRRTNFEKAWNEDEHFTGGLTIKHAGSNHSLASVGSREFGGLPSSGGSFAESGHGSGSQNLDLANEEAVDSPPTMTSPLREISMRIRWGGNTFYSIDGRPCYFKDAHPNPPGLGGLLEDRFAAMKADGMPIRPNRRPSLDLEWSDDECSHSGHESERETNENLCPDIWITPMDGDVDVAKDLWRVRRVWNIDALDEHEVEHAVEQEELVDVVKVLAGVADKDVQNADGEALDYDPNSTLWRTKTVYEVNGEIDESSPTLDFSEQAIRKAIGDISMERAPAIEEIRARFSYRQGDGEGDDDDERNGQRMHKSISEDRELPSAMFIHGSGAESEDDDEWNGNRMEKSNHDDKAPNGRFVHGSGDDVEDDDEWDGKRLEKSRKGKNTSPDGKFSFGAGDTDEDDGDWNGTQVAKTDAAGTSAGHPSTNDAKCIYGDGENHGEEDGDWNGKRFEKSQAGSDAGDAKCVYDAGEDHTDDEGEWKGKRAEKTNSKSTYGSAENDGDEDDVWKGKQAGKTQEGESAESPDENPPGKTQEGESAESPDEPPPRAPANDETPRIRSTTLDDDTEDTSSRAVKGGVEDELEEFASPELTVEPKEKKKKKKKKKHKDYDHGMTISDLLGAPPIKVFHDEYF
jgi:hypothetical protein